LRVRDWRIRFRPVPGTQTLQVLRVCPLNTNKVFTIDRQDFETYRVRRGHRYYRVEIVR